MKTIISTPDAPAPIGPYSQAVMHGNMLFTSGQIAFNPETDALVLDDIKTETKHLNTNPPNVI